MSSSGVNVTSWINNIQRKRRDQPGKLLESRGVEAHAEKTADQFGFHKAPWPHRGLRPGGEAQQMKVQSRRPRGAPAEETEPEPPPPQEPPQAQIKQTASGRAQLQPPCQSGLQQRRRNTQKLFLQQIQAHVGAALRARTHRRAQQP